MAILAAGTHSSFKRESNKHQFHCGRCSMKTVPSPQTSWLVFIAEAGFASWQTSAPRKSRVGFWITSEFRHARLRWRRPSSSNFPSPSNDHGQLKLRIGVSPSCCITPSHRAYFHPPPEKLRQTWAALAPSKHKTHYVTSPHSAKPRRWPPDTCGMAFEKLILRIIDDIHHWIHARASSRRGNGHNQRHRFQFDSKREHGSIQRDHGSGQLGDSDAIGGYRPRRSDDWRIKRHVTRRFGKFRVRIHGPVRRWPANDYQLHTGDRPG